MNDHEIMIQLERLAQGFPWNNVDLWVSRRPSGEVHYTAYVAPNSKMGQTNTICTIRDTAAETVDEALRRAHEFDPEESRRKAIEEMKDKIRKLEAINIGFPPYVPNRELCEHNPELKNHNPKARAQTIDV